MNLLVDYNIEMLYSIKLLIIRYILGILLLLWLVLILLLRRYFFPAQLAAFLEPVNTYYNI